MKSNASTFIITRQNTASQTTVLAHL